MSNSPRPNGAEIAATYMEGAVPESIKCTLQRKLFSHCSYCSCPIGKGPGWISKDAAKRCNTCGWVYCSDHVKDEGHCEACLDTAKAADHAGISLIKSAIVVGTGMGGLAATLAMKNRGVREVTILERTDVLRTSGGPILVQTNATRALLDIDPKVMEKVFDTAGPLDDDGAFKTIDEKALFASKLSTKIESRRGNPEGRSIVRGNLQQILYNRCVEVGIKVHFGMKVVDVEQDADRVTVTAEAYDREKRSFTADFLVASDGIWSRVRQVFFPDVPAPVYQGYQMIISRAPTDKFDQMEMDCWGELWGKAHRFGFFRCGDGGTGIYYARTCEEDLDKDKTQKELKQILIDAATENRYDEKVVKLAKAAEISRLYRFPIRHLQPLSHHACGRVVLLGDAANAMQPNLGQGGGMALESASILSQCLLIGETLSKGLEKYETRRIGRTSVIANESKTDGDLFQASNAFTVLLRDSLFSYLGKQTYKEGVDELEIPDPFAYLFSYRLLSWPHPVK
mmetsp:Transcript_52971/g.79015  ORF Transcript_52971/g.79015 Transcript_52971/m.79015 type:complete len:511 (+) Transcript_52971:90-1622(+)